MSRSLQVPDDLQEFTSFGSVIDLYTTKVRFACQVEILAGSGTLSVKMAGSGGSTRVLTVNAGDIVYGKFTSIEAVSGLTRVRVGWN